MTTEYELRQVQRIIGELTSRIDALEAENAVLWSFVRADDAWHDYSEGGDGSDDVFERRSESRESLRQYEDTNGKR